MSDDNSIRKILILAAHPLGTDQLRLDEEARDIKEGLRQASERDRFVLHSEWAVRPRDVRRALLNFKPHIVQFSGHGAEDGGLAFENELGNIQLVSPEALAGLFKLFSEFVECVLLNACYSEIQAQAIAQHINFVIGMNREIGDRAAIEFAVGFYDALGSGCSVKTAYEFGCNAISLAGIAEFSTPVLKCKNSSLPERNPDLSPTTTLIKDSMTRSVKLENPSKVTYEFVLTGSVNEVSKQKLEAIVEHLQKITGDASLTLLKIESGSIKLILEGSEESFRLLEALVASGELNEVLGVSVEGINRKESDILLPEETPPPIIRNQHLSVEAEVEVIGIERRNFSIQTVDREALEIGFTHDDFAALLDKYDYHFSPGDIVPGTVFSIEPMGALINIGAKTAAYIPIQEMSINRIESPEEVLQLNEIREFFILTDENEDGQLTLSIRRIEYMQAWKRVRQLQAEDATIRAEVFAMNRGGALVRIEGLRGFIPGSHISTDKSKEELVGEELPLKFLEVDEERNRLVLSHRRALVKRRMNRLAVGDAIAGIVRGIKPYGVFVDIDGVSGLLHISEISQEHIDTPHSVFSVNDEIVVMVIDIDAQKGRISLSTKKLEPEPGDIIRNRQLVYDKAEEMAALYREQLLAKQQGQAAALAVEEIPSAIDEEIPASIEE
jgi:small subunit ribosomal protein S1